MFLLRETDYKKVKILFWVAIVDLRIKYSKSVNIVNLFHRINYIFSLSPYFLTITLSIY